MPAVAFFDLDKTLISRSSVLALAGPLREAGLIRWSDVLHSFYTQATFVLGTADHDEMERLRRYISGVMTGWSVDRVERVIGERVAEVVGPLVYPEAVDLIDRHHAGGDAVVMVTSTGVELARPIGRLLGVDEVIGTRMEIVGGHYTGEIDDYMYADRKAEAIAEYAAAHGVDLADCSAYSDSATDEPMLAAVGHPYATNPDHDLLAVARRNGWPVLSFRPISPERSVRAAGTAAIVLAGAAAIAAVGVGSFAWWSARPRRPMPRAVTEDELAA